MCFKKFIMIKLLIIALLLPLAVQADEKVDENALFADSSSLVDSAKVVNTQVAKSGAEEKKGVGFSGTVYAYGNPSLGRTWFDSPAILNASFDSRIVGNAFIDVRLIGGAKAFADLQSAFVPTPSFASLDPSNLGRPDSGMVFDAPELFVDANIKKNAYFRAGKQVLQWGPCNFWNPTDLVNVEHKTFLLKQGQREGTYGLKIHVPYKTLFNFYSFIDANNAATIDSLAAAVKAEVLLGRTEMALSAWGKKGKIPVVGYDLTSQLFNVQIAAEASLRNGCDMVTLDSTLSNMTTLGNRWFPRIALGLTKFMPLAGVADRLTLSAELYYNHAGYDTNFFNNPAVIRNIHPTLPLDTAQRHADLLRMPWLADPLNFSRLYEPNSYSKYYAAIFGSISRFILDDMTFSCNAIGNLQQKCFVVSTGVDYQSLNDFVFGVSLNAFLGPKNTEYTFSGNGLMVQLRTGIIF